MSITIDCNLNVIVKGQRTGCVAIGANNLAGLTTIYAGDGYHKTARQRTVHITEPTGPALWTGHIQDLTLEAFLEATGYVAPDQIVITAPAGTKSRWVHKSQSEGAKLSDWVISKVDQA